MQEWQLDRRRRLHASPARRWWSRTSPTALADSLLRLLVVALLVMALVLALVFRSAPAAAAAGGRAGGRGDHVRAMALLGASLTMASIAVLPVLLGLGGRLRDPVPGAGRGGGAGRRAERRRRPRARRAWRCRRSPPPALATAVGFLVLLLSPVPMVRGFGLLLVVGIVIAFFLALSAGTAALVGAGARGAGSAGRARRARRAARRELRRRAGRAAGRALARPLRRVARARRRSARAARRARAARGACWLIGAGARAGAGWARRLADEVVLRHARARAAGPARRCATSTRCSARPASRARSTWSSRATTSPSPTVVTWMRDYQAGLLKRFGYSTKNGCGKAALCPALSLPDLFRAADAAADQAAHPRAARRRAAVLLPGGHHARTARRRRWRSASG